MYAERLTPYLMTFLLFLFYASSIARSSPTFEEQWWQLSETRCSTTILKANSKVKCWNQRRPCIHTSDKMEGMYSIGLIRSLISNILYRFLYRNFDVQNGIFSSNFFLTMYELVYLNPGTRDRRLRLVDTCAQSICLLFVAVSQKNTLNSPIVYASYWFSQL
jgi:hypothetical protein